MRALAQVLESQGIPVEIVRGEKALLDADLDDRTMVVVTNPQALGPSTFRTMDATARQAQAGVVVVGLSEPALDGFGFIVNELAEPSPDEDVRANCSPARDAYDGLTLRTDNELRLPGNGCFGDREGYYLVTTERNSRWLLTASSALTNDRIDDADNAAIALRLLGQRDRVVWYVADTADTTTEDGVSIDQFLPDWLYPSLGLVLAAVISLLLWQGRRLGPLVTEPLPVRIKSLESVLGRGRLYQRSRARTHAAGHLIAGSRRRLGSALALNPRADTSALVAAVCAATGRPEHLVRTLLAWPAERPGPIPDDATLVSLATQLRQLEEEVRAR